jgi:putative transposase
MDHVDLQSNLVSVEIKQYCLMQDLHIVATYPKRRTTIPNHEHRKYPYLLCGIVPSHPNRIWSTDITYIGLSLGFAYLIADSRRQTTDSRRQ